MPSLPIDAEALDASSWEPMAIVAAIATVVAGWILSRVARRTIVKIGGRIEGLRPEYAKLIGRIVAYLVLFLGIGIALSFLGAELQPLIATVILVSVILALALRGIAENFAAGVVLQSRQPIRIGDEIDTLGFNGVVRDINGRSVVIESVDGRRIHLPNSQVLTNPLVNDTTLGARRTEIEVRIATEDPSEIVGRLLHVVEGAPGVLADPPARVHVTGIDAGRITTLVHFWHEPSRHRPVASQVLQHLAASGLGSLVATTSLPDPPLTPPAEL